ncbi:Peptidyl-prolyl isomerase cwc27 [Tulasnella sp. JGI-2019a]|nr:Peptidyl-prolyl isomerase cwc27 [Tulasnella sp. JGI-2019a]KAG9008643.1 Peptidyl-prolyl isomerase cwc27 [Tulasnella sp. JGI-2019a]KAG9033834.1 Peptidyl-prolyl isomerase cwc27 [Tulasnella sp. JGI-2019a]
MALPVNGRIVIETTVGDIEIEMWSKEAPKACRNFLALAMEGYYDGVIFHRVVPDFLIQTGDRTGTGGGGESFYGEPFADEIHPRLKFAHRGLVGCANNGQKNSNDSQFFITLDRADELNGKHTLWGRCVGDTFFNALKIGQTEVGENERPVYPPKIKTVRIEDNPFDDIIPRITAAEKRAQQKAREEAQKEREEQSRRKGAKKNVGLLSFGMGGGTVEDEEPVTFKKKPIARPDLIDDQSIISEPPMPSGEKLKASKSTGDEQKISQSSKQSKVEVLTPADLKAIRSKHASEKDAAKESQQEKIARMEADIKKLSRRHGDDSDEDEAERQRAAKKAKGPSALEQELAKYSKGRTAGGKKGQKRDEGDVLAKLSSFRSKIRDAPGGGDDDGMDGEGGEEKDKTVGNEEVEGVEIDDDRDWLSHRLKFSKTMDLEEQSKAQDHYEVIDPRERGRQAKNEEKDRKGQRKGGPSKVFNAGRR